MIWGSSTRGGWTWPASSPRGSSTAGSGTVDPGGQPSPVASRAGGQMTGVRGFSVQTGEGTTLPTPTDDVITIKADTRQTNGGMTVMELRVAPGSGPATHTHLREDELWWVLEGDFRFRTADDWLRASTGGMA